MAKQQKLTPKQEAFCDEYLVDFSATGAAIRAGYSKRTAGRIGYNLLKKPHVQETLTNLREKRRQERRTEADRVLDDCRELVDRCMQAKPVLDSDGEPTGMWTFNAAGAKGGLELLGKHFGLWNDKLTLAFTEQKARDLIIGITKIIWRHVKDRTVLAAIKSDIADLMGGGDA